VLDDLVETGLDCIGPLDPLGGFTCAQARQTVGDRIALMGGVNTLSFINRTPEQIAEEAATCIQDAGQAGGYVLGSGCVVPRDAKRECLEALVRVVREHGQYRDGRLTERREKTEP
jgi:uroporphyrinogen-III decarboxylase